MDPNGPLLNLLKYSEKFPNFYFCEIFELLLKIHRKLTSGYLFVIKPLSRLVFFGAMIDFPKG
jgi:hypothetical protein